MHDHDSALEGDDERGGRCIIQTTIFQYYDKSDDGNAAHVDAHADDDGGDGDGGGNSDGDNNGKLVQRFSLLVFWKEFSCGIVNITLPEETSSGFVNNRAGPFQRDIFKL